MHIINWNPNEPRAKLESLALLLELWWMGALEGEIYVLITSKVFQPLHI